MLNWAVSKNQCDYQLLLPPLSEEEEQVAESVSKMFIEFHDKSADNPTYTIKHLLQLYCDRNQIQMDKKQALYLTRYVYLNIVGFSGLEELLDNEALEEIAIIGINQPVYVYHNTSGWLKTNLIFRNEEGATNVINKIARPLGRRITYQEPKLNAVLPDGSRLHASIPPLSDVELTVRKFRRNPLTIADLINGSVYSVEQLAFLSLVFQLDYNVLISGNTASGKTSSLNAMFSFVPLSDRILIVEETPEINVPHQHVVKLLANQNLAINMQELVEDSLRMRPDRVIVGEIRSKDEIKAFIDTILSGQGRGSYATFHAQSSEETVKRLVSREVSATDVSSLDFLITQRRILRYDPSNRKSWEERRCSEISELVENGQVPKINNLFSFSYGQSQFIGAANKSKRFEEIADKLSITPHELSAEISERTQFLSELSAKALCFEDTVYAIQSFLFSKEGVSQWNSEKQSLLQG